MRIPQPGGTKGSLKWIQRIVGDNPALLSDAVRVAAQMPPSWNVAWASPLPSDSWAEYRDADFLALLNLGRLADDLEKFWPRGGPQWDALGRSSDGGVVLVEAKSHMSELVSSCAAAHESRILIASSLDIAKAAFGADWSADWLNGFYQYANRLAHLDFLQRHHVPVRLAFVYFVRDREMGGPDSIAEWKKCLASLYAALGLSSESGLPGVCNVFIDIGLLPPTVAV